MTNATSELHPPPLRRSAWTTKQKIIRVLWGLVGRVLWQVPAWRSGVLRRFGGTVGRGCRFARSVQVAIPWNVHIGDDVEVGEQVMLYSLGTIRIEDGVVLDYGAHLCAGSHDHTDSRFPLTTPPVSIGRGCFIGIDAYIGPNVALGAECRVWPRASVYKSFEAGTELRGNPARPVPPGEDGGDGA